MFKIIARFTRDASGATAIEYGLITALVAVAAIAAFNQFAGSVTNMHEYVSSSVGDAISGG